MKTNFLTVLGASLLAVGLSQSALAEPIVNDNDRPVTIGTGPATETTLQEVLDARLGGVSQDDQSTAGKWGSATGAPATTIPTLVLEATSGASTQVFGIWFGSDTNDLFLYDLILGAGSTTGLFPAAAGLTIVDGALQVTGDCAQVNCGTAFNSLIDPFSFGFYFRTGGGLTAYSIDMMNSYDATRFLSYTDGATNWIFAFEDGRDFDFNDMIVKVESIREVPEPGTLALLGLGLAGIGFARRRKA